MKAFIYRYDEKTGYSFLGSDNSGVTNEYKTLSGLRKNAVLPFLKRFPNDSCIVHIYYNWDNRYGKADLNLIYGQDGQCEKLPPHNPEGKILYTGE